MEDLHRSQIHKGERGSLYAIYTQIIKTSLQFYRLYENDNQILPGNEEVPPSFEGYEFEFDSPVHRKIAAAQIVRGLNNVRRGHGESTMLRTIPIKNPPHLQKAMGTEGWGIHANQGLSVMKITRWMIVVQVLGLTFASIWLTLINKTDLQNAFLPVTFLTTLCVGCFGVLQLLAVGWGIPLFLVFGCKINSSYDNDQQEGLEAPYHLTVQFNDVSFLATECRNNDVWWLLALMGWMEMLI